MQSTTVRIGTSVCNIQSITSSIIKCITSSSTAGNYTLSINSNNVAFPSKYFLYTALSTPTVSQISPTSGSSGQLITITGSGFGFATSNPINPIKIFNYQKNLDLIKIYIFRCSKRFNRFCFMCCSNNL